MENVVPKTPTSLLVRAILFVPGVFLVFLLSILLMIAVASAIIGLIFWIIEFFSLSVVPSGVIMLLILGVVAGIGAILKGIIQVIWRKEPSQPAIKINLKDEPELNKFLTELCLLMGTKKPKSIILHAEPTFFVTNSRVNALNGKTRGRVLAIGLPLLPVLTVNEFRAILSHEFAHFTGKDTVYSSFVLPVYISTTIACREIGRVLYHKSDDSNWMSVPLFIPYMIMDFYLSAFHSLNMRISRLREKRADIVATLKCGTNSFSMGLRKVVAYSGVFTYQSKTDIITLLNKDKAYINYYEVFRNKLTELYDLATTYDTNAMNEQENQDNQDNQDHSHPVLVDRLKYIPQDVQEQFKDDENLAMHIIEHLKEYEEQLTEGYTQYVAVIGNAQANNMSV